MAMPHELKDLEDQTEGQRRIMLTASISSNLALVYTDRRGSFANWAIVRRNDDRQNQTREKRRRDGTHTPTFTGISPADLTNPKLLRMETRLPCTGSCTRQRPKSAIRSLLRPWSVTRIRC
jgi:hypothetical protein